MPGPASSKRGVRRCTETLHDFIQLVRSRFFGCKIRTPSSKGIYPFVNHTDYVHKGDYCYLGLFTKRIV